VLRDCIHRNQTRAFDVANGVLLRFSHIDQSKRNVISIGNRSTERECSNP
jgi:hypothetical protein